MMNDHERAVALLDRIEERVAGIRQRVDQGDAAALGPLCERLQQAESLLEESPQTVAPTAGHGAAADAATTDWKTLLIAGAIVAGFMMFVAAADGTGASSDILFGGLLTTAVFGGAGWLAGAKVMQRVSILPAVVAGFVAWVVLAGILSAIGMGASSAPFAAMFGAAVWYGSSRSARPRA